MATPSREQFDEWATCIAAPLGTEPFEIFALATRDMDHCLLSDATRFVEKFCDELAERRKELAKLEVNIWLSNQAGWKRALEINERRKHSTLTKQQFINTRSLRIVGDVGQRYFMRRARSFMNINNPQDGWRGQVVASINDYLHVNHEAVFKAKKNFNKNCAEIKRCLQEMQPFLDSVIYDFSDRSKLIDSHITTWQTYVEPGVIRNQVNKAEHSFIFSMFLTNFDIFRSARPNLIAELMTLECFDRQMDPRSIARICSDLAGAKNQRKRRYFAMVNNQMLSN